MSNKTLCCGFAFFLFGFFTISVQAVVFTDDNFQIYEDGEMIENCSVLIFSHYDGIEVFEEIYNGDVFEKSQNMVSNLTFFKINNSDIDDYISWKEKQEDGTHSQYVDIYIQNLLNNSLYNTTIEVKKPEDNETYNSPVFGTGGIIGSYRYFKVDIKTGSIDLIETKIPEAPGFEISILLLSSILFLFWRRKHKLGR